MTYPTIFHRSASMHHAKLTLDSTAWVPHLSLADQREHFAPLAHKSNQCAKQKHVNEISSSITDTLYLCCMWICTCILYSLSLYQVISKTWWWPTGRPKHVVVNCYVSTKFYCCVLTAYLPYCKELAIWFHKNNHIIKATIAMSFHTTLKPYHNTRN